MKKPLISPIIHLYELIGATIESSPTDNAFIRQCVPRAQRKPASATYSQKFRGYCAQFILIAKGIKQMDIIKYDEKFIRRAGKVPASAFCEAFAIGFDIILKNIAIKVPNIV